jgi:hypothetical protein
MLYSCNNFLFLFNLFLGFFTVKTKKFKFYIFKNNIIVINYFNLINKMMIIKINIYDNNGLILIAVIILARANA